MERRKEEAGREKKTEMWRPRDVVRIPASLWGRTSTVCSAYLCPGSGRDTVINAYATLASEPLMAWGRKQTSSTGVKNLLSLDSACRFSDPYHTVP